MTARARALSLLIALPASALLATPATAAPAATGAPAAVALAAVADSRAALAPAPTGFTRSKVETDRAITRERVCSGHVYVLVPSGSGGASAIYSKTTPIADGSRVTVLYEQIVSTPGATTAGKVFNDLRTAALACQREGKRSTKVSAARTVAGASRAFQVSQVQEGVTITINVYLKGRSVVQIGAARADVVRGGEPVYVGAKQGGPLARAFALKALARPGIG